MEVDLRIQSGCMVCGKSPAKSRCRDCQFVSYCNPGHEKLGWEDHKTNCYLVRTRLLKLQHEERSLSTKPGYFALEGKHYGNTVRLGRQRSDDNILENPEYMIRRFNFADDLVEMGNYESLVCARDNFVDMLRLNKPDDMLIRNVLPHIMLRLGEDQRVYNFIKWWQGEGSSGILDCGNTADLPYFDSEDADPFEPVKLFAFKMGGFPDISLVHASAIALIKIRMLNDLTYIQTCRDAVGSRLPEELLNEIQRYTLTSSIILHRKETFYQDNRQLITTLRAQLFELLKVVHKRNSHMWAALVDPDYITGSVSYHSETYGTSIGRQLPHILHLCYHSWEETPHAIELL